MLRSIRTVFPVCNNYYARIIALERKTFSIVKFFLARVNCDFFEAPISPGQKTTKNCNGGEQREKGGGPETFIRLLKTVNKSFFFFPRAYSGMSP
jgi:hypothetical protein